MVNKQQIIASVTKDEQIKSALESGIKRVNLLSGNIMNLAEVIEKMHQVKKEVYVHFEMVQGLGKDAHAVRYLTEVLKADGVISTKSNIIIAARNEKLKTIQRIFAIDSNALETAEKMIASSGAHEIELMPGLMPRVIREMKAKIRKPLIVGGLIKYEQEIKDALNHGADYVSIGDCKFW
jgi:glycerol uptake operon antiterminator